MDDCQITDKELTQLLENKDNFVKSLKEKYKEKVSEELINFGLYAFVEAPILYNKSQCKIDEIKELLTEINNKLSKMVEQG